MFVTAAVITLTYIKADTDLIFLGNIFKSFQTHATKLHILAKCHLAAGSDQEMSGIP